MDSVTFWNEIGSKKEFEDPFYLEKAQPYLTSDSTIVEYGCGYGRILRELFSQGYRNVYGFDIAEKMIERGKNIHPQISLSPIRKSGHLPLNDKEADLVILSTVLCCIVNKLEQKKVIDEIHRVLKPNGILYCTDFLITPNAKFEKKYQETPQDYGVYTTSEGATVRHHTSQWMMELLMDFNLLWYEQFDFKTMNQNAVKTFHSIAQKF